MKKVIEASDAVAEAVKLCRVEVCPMYPITPSTHIPERISEFVANGEMNAQIIDVESEHSAASAFIGVVASGSRAFTATSSQGLALMYEILPIISGMRLPGVMAVANRALSAPINIWNDHSDAVSARDQGWIQLYAESSQESLDSIIQGYKISENKNVFMPLMVCFDGFSLTHVFEPVDIPEQKKVDSFLPKFKPLHWLDVKKPMSFGPIGFPDSFMHFKRQQQEAMENSINVIKKANSAFKKSFGRSYGSGLLDLYRMQDAEYAVVAMGTACGTARVAIDVLRKKGKKVGLARVRSLRPFPEKELQSAIKGIRAVAVIDRHISLGQEGPLFTDVRNAIYCNDIPINSYIAGLGGRDITVKHFEKVFTDLEKGKQKGEWLF
ncbi:MAG: pyruvate ferredoxin oxidoreductase [Candidatus Diapherotrites archaeon]|uniref:Pyruvate ferredoxin oxidoreductase n=1 Tax=Candidatus Iainarchaeum sp. TaxID=3101447 RepID=A0A938YUL8_9ARCH|nr:pyruvate ferredoxin oxidoreductase [Candidatus Diapherotrites archaeon]